jgi:hypothetical protein
LSDAQIQLLIRWIDAGAEWPETDVDRQALQDPRKEHWAFQPVARVHPPSITPATRDAVLANTGWPSSLDHPIDRFIIAGLAAQNLTMSPEADRRTLIRRLSFDLRGLAPSLAEVEAFVNDRHPDAWARLVDSMLNSPRYGERWAQHWLDLVRYADTHGFEVNTPRDHAWHYRDYVIHAFNQDLPYDQFVREQLVGDAYGQPAATGFLVAAAALLPGQIGADDASKRLARQDELDEIIIGTSATIMGLTLGCARCHDHKFDPLTQRDYYAMQAFFAGVEYGDRPLVGESFEADENNASGADAGFASADRGDAGCGDADRGDAGCSDTDRGDAGCGDAAGENSSGAGEAVQTPPAEQPLVFAGKFREPDVTYVLRRGDAEQPVDPIGPAVPELFQEPIPWQAREVGSDPSLLSWDHVPDQRRRAELARWLTSPNHPLTARVMVNRIWLYHFGSGLVATPSDFGVNGAEPSHPELLDWLASELIRREWSIKSLHRMILLSATYRQSSQVRVDAADQDRGNRWLWRFPARRIEAESIRDSMLSVTGELNLQMGGPGFNFFQSRGGLHGFPPVEAFGPAELRRMVYAHKVRMEPVPVFGAFDCPDAGQPTPQRSRSTTSIQALNLLNSSFTMQRAARFATRVMQDLQEETARPEETDGPVQAVVDAPTKVASTAADQQVRYAFLLALGREPSAEEREASVQVVDDFGLETLCRVLLNSNEFLFCP